MVVGKTKDGGDGQASLVPAGQYQVLLPLVSLGKVSGAEVPIFARRPPVQSEVPSFSPT